MPNPDRDSDRDRGVDYRQFLQAVRRFTPSALLRALALDSARHYQMRLGRTASRGRKPRWIMQAIAAESIVHGTDFQRRTRVREADLVRLANLYWQSDRLGPEPSVAVIMTPLVHEQFLSQQSEYEELCRAQALLADGFETDPALDWVDLFGFDLSDGLRCSLLLNAWVVSNDGRFDPGLLQLPHVRDAIDRFTSHELLLAVARRLTATLPTAREAAFAGGHARGVHGVYEFNPLYRYPLIDLAGDGVWAPQTSLVSAAFLPRNLYYAGFQRWGQLFPHRLGLRLEEYVGRQLRLAAGDQLRPKVVYRRNKADAESVDWFWVHPDAVVLVEVKSARLTAGALNGQDLETVTARYLTKARAQIDETAELVRQRHPRFAGIPADRPLIGLAVTGEPIHLANSMLPEYGTASATPSVVVSARDVELLVTHPAGWVIEHLLRVVQDPQLRTHVFHTTLPDRPGPVLNPILDAAWAQIAPAVEAAEEFSERPPR